MAAADDDLYDEGWAGTTTTDVILKAACIGAVVLGAASVLAGFGWWLHRTFIVPSRPRRTP